MWDHKDVPLPLVSLFSCGSIRPGCGQLCPHTHNALVSGWSMGHWECTDEGVVYTPWRISAYRMVPMASEFSPKGCSGFRKIELLGVNRGAQGRENRESRYKKSNDSRQEVTVFGCSTRYVEGIRERNI